MRNEIYDLRQYWLSFYQDKRPYLVSDVIWDYYCELFEKTLNWQTEYNLFLKFLERNNINTLLECRDFIDNITNNVIKKIDKRKLYSKKYDYYGTYTINTPDGYYFKIDLCDASFNYFIKNDIIKDTKWNDFVETNDEFINHKVFKTYIYNSINYHDRYYINKQYLDNILASDDELVYELKNIEHTMFYFGDALVFNFHNEDNVQDFIKRVTQYKKIGEEIVHTDIFKKETLFFNKVFDKSFPQIAVIDDLVTGKLEFKKYNFIDYQMYLPQIQKLYLKEDITENDLIYGYHDRLCKFDIPLSLININ